MAKKKSKKEVRICILQRGWVYVGNYSQSGDECTLENAKCVRRWGTTKGLGEIALDGPTKDTVLDPAGTVRFHPLTVVGTLDCDGAKWQTALS